VDNVLVWIVWLVAAFACLGSGAAVVSFANPFYSALARQPVRDRTGLPE
jgi:hypothetical protein